MIVLWEDTGFFARAVFGLLGFLLIAGLCVLLDGMRRQRALARQARTVATDFWQAPNLYEAVTRLESDSAYRRIAQTGLEAATHVDGKLTDRIGTSEWIALSLDRAVRELSDSLCGRAGALALIAPVSVSVGLGGVTYILAESVAGLTARAGPEEFAPGVGEALWVGTLALVVAVTATAGYSWLMQRTARATGRMQEFAAEIRALLLSADRSIFNEKADVPVQLPPRDRIRAGTAAH